MVSRPVRGASGSVGSFSMVYKGHRHHARGLILAPDRQHVGLDIGIGSSFGWQILDQLLPAAGSMTCSDRPSP